MKKFVALYIGSASAASKAARPIDQEVQRRGMEAWGKWMTQHQANIVDAGAPLGRMKKASKIGIANATNKVTAYVIVQAESHEAAAQMFSNHPHFSIFPGDSVEIVECLTLPDA